MKKNRFIWMVALILTIIPAHAQFQIGVKGGINLSSVSFKGSKSNLRPENRTGFFIGPMAEVNLPVFGIGIDASALYNQNTLECEYANTNLKTIELPINLRWSVGLGNILGVYVAGGPQFGFNVGKSWDSNYRIEKRKTSFNVGGGLKLFRHIELGVNYNFAFQRTATLFLSGEKDGNIPGIKVKNNSWQVCLVYLL